ncbi:MAG: hypothetical protein JO153_21735 [Solirubrobacterales bacterium]|nr:hypothetical protein [Solirubrobacterales bacterium]
MPLEEELLVIDVVEVVEGDEVTVVDEGELAIIEPLSRPPPLRSAAALPPPARRIARVMTTSSERRIIWRGCTRRRSLTRS